MSKPKKTHSKAAVASNPAAPTPQAQLESWIQRGAEVWLIMNSAGMVIQVPGFLSSNGGSLGFSDGHGSFLLTIIPGMYRMEFRDAPPYRLVHFYLGDGCALSLGELVIPAITRKLADQECATNSVQ